MMGECGCASTSPELRLPGPEGVHYGLEIYPGCHYCSTPAGVVVYRFDDEEADVWLIGAEEAEFQTYQGINGEVVRPVLEARFLAEELAEWREDDDVTEQEIQQALPQAVWKTQRAWFESTPPPDTQETESHENDLESHGTQDGEG